MFDDVLKKLAVALSAFVAKAEGVGSVAKLQQRDHGVWEAVRVDDGGPLFQDAAVRLDPLLEPPQLEQRPADARQE